MKLVALIGGFLIFIFTWFIVSLLLASLVSFCRNTITIGIVTTNIASVIGLFFATLAARHSYKSTVNRYKEKQDKESN